MVTPILNLLKHKFLHRACGWFLSPIGSFHYSPDVGEVGGAVVGEEVGKVVGREVGAGIKIWVSGLKAESPFWFCAATRTVYQLPPVALISTDMLVPATVRF